MHKLMTEEQDNNEIIKNLQGGRWTQWTLGKTTQWSNIFAHLDLDIVHPKEFV
jgi:hypothetical protein